MPKRALPSQGVLGTASPPRAGRPAAA